MKRGLFFLYSMFFLLSVAQGSIAIGIAPSTIELEYLPGRETHIEITVFNTGSSPINASFGFGGPFGSLLLRTPETFVLEGGGSKRLNVTLRFPEKIEPGDHTIPMSAQELPLGAASGISVLGSLTGTIHFFVPYPGTYASLTLQSTHANVGEPLLFTLTAHNLGKRPLAHMQGYLFLLDSLHQEVGEFATSITDLLPGESRDVVLTLDTTSYAPGEYLARAYGKYHAITTKEQEIPFRIGQLFVNITEGVIIPYPDHIYKVTLTLQSMWNGVLDGVYATVSVLDDYQREVAHFSSPTVSVPPWEKTTLSSFWDGKDLTQREYTAKVTLFYADKETSITIPLVPREESDETEQAFLLLTALIIIIILDYFWLKKRAATTKKTDRTFEL